MARPKNVLILDLDETLVHTFDDARDLNVHIEHPGLRDRLYVLDYYNSRDRKQEHQVGVRRPNLDIFLKKALEMTDLFVIWTAASESYANDLITKIIKMKGHRSPDIVLTADDCLEHQGETTKPVRLLFDMYPKLSKLTTVDNIIIIDDRKSNLKFNAASGIHIDSYHPEPTAEGIQKDDTALLAALEIVKKRFCRTRLD